MRLEGRVVVVTGGARGLGASAAVIARERGAEAVVVLDRDADGADLVCDVGVEEDVQHAVKSVLAQHGRIDVWVQNAGIGAHSSSFTDDEVWHSMWRVHVMAGVYATRHLLPHWLDRGEGHFNAVASSNALTSNPVSAAYAVTKHAELAFTEWLAFTYASRGLEASCFCPKGMRTPLLVEGARVNAYAADALAKSVSQDEAATMLIDLIESGEFLATTYPPVLEEYRLRSTDPAAYLELMRGVHDELVPEVGTPPTDAGPSPLGREQA